MDNLLLKSAAMCACLMLWAIPGRAQVGTWEKMVLPAGETVWISATHTEGWDQEEARLAADAQGRLYFSNRGTLLIGTVAATHWEKYVHPNVTGPISRSFMMAAGGQGQVTWGAMHSEDGGKTWDLLPWIPLDGSLGSNRHGAYFMGAKNDDIFRSDPPFVDWTPVHVGAESFGYLYQFASCDAGNMAALGLEGVYLSIDTGGSWQSMGNRFESNYNGYNLLSIALEPRQGGTLWLSPKPGSELGNSLTRVNMLTRKAETVAGNMPDSTVNVIRVGSDGAIWLGTWGQGVWVSRNEGKTFTAQNTGLNSVYVKALQETSDGRMYALTPTGLFRFKGEGTGLRPLLISQGTRPGPLPSLYLSGIRRSLRQTGAAGSRFSVLANGRSVLPALPSRATALPQGEPEASAGGKAQ